MAYPPTLKLELFTVYENPKDFPESFVVRRWVVGIGSEPVPDPLPLAVALTLDEVREKLLAEKPHLHRLEREPGDDACIVETWL